MGGIRSLNRAAADFSSEQCDGGGIDLLAEKGLPAVLSKAKIHHQKNFPVKRRRNLQVVS